MSGDLADPAGADIRSGQPAVVDRFRVQVFAIGPAFRHRFRGIGAAAAF
ncbi:hypothetical protein [Burkholderia sp. MSh2]|nr:hypothetical protein [Burkholderia sp. MSh2]